MIKRILVLFLLVMALSLSACTPKALSNPDASRPTSTIPAIETQTPPAVHLSQAIGKTVESGAYVIRYGTIWQGAETMSEQQVMRVDGGYVSLSITPQKKIFYNRNQMYILTGQTVQTESSGKLFTSDAVFEDVRSFLPNGNLLKDMTNHRLSVASAGDGALDYICGSLDEAELGDVLFDGTLPADLLPDGYAKAEGTITCRLDKEGRFTELRVEIDLYHTGNTPDDTFTMVVSFEQIGTLPSIPVPEWVPAA